MLGLDSFNLINEFERASNESNAEKLASKGENIGFNGYIGTWILRIYRIYWRYIGGYFYMNINISEIKLL